MRKLYLLTVFVIISFNPAVQAQIMLLDQIGPSPSSINGQGSANSQRFEPLFTAFDAVSGDNFVVPLGSSVTLTHVAFVLTGFNGSTAASFPAIQNYEVQIYSSPSAAANNLTGDISSTIVGTVFASSTVPFGTNPGPSGLIDLNVSTFNITLAPGTYWMGVIPRLDFNPNGQMGISGTTFGGGTGDGFLANPGAGFNLPGNLISNLGDLAYRIDAIAVPEPTTWALIGFSLVTVSGLIYRRKVNNLRQHESKLALKR